MNEIASIVIGSDYFRKNARSDYGNPLPFVWIREAIQNSVDAGATEIKIETEGPYLTFSDNGCGMDLDTLTHKLLTLGGTKKEAGSVGGFGKAKEILFFSWDEWSIDTSIDGKTRYYVSQLMLGKSPIAVYEDKGSGVGTTIKIKMEDYLKVQYMGDGDSEGFNVWENYIQEYVHNCTTKCKLYLNDIELSKYNLNKRAKKVTEHYRLIVDKERQNSNMLVRVNGILMHDRYVSSGIKGSVILELLGDTTQLLTGNRDSLTYRIGREIDELTTKMAINPKTALTEDVPPQIDRYLGIDLVTLTSISDGAFNVIEECTSSGITNFMKAEKLAIYKNIDFSEEFLSILKEEHENVGPLGYEFIVKRSGRTKPNIKIDGKRAQTILNYWANIMVRLIEDSGIRMNIGVGFTFNEESVAELIKINEKEYFLVNPNHVGKTGGQTELGIDLFMIACHEFAHTYYVDHDERFSSRLGSLLSGLASKWSEWQDLFVLSKREVLSVFE